MRRTIAILVMISVLLLSVGCTRGNAKSAGVIDITGITSSIGAVEGNTSSPDIQSFKYTITMTNNAADITIISVNPVLSEKFLERVKDKDVSVQVNMAAPQGSSIFVSGEIIFDAKGLTKEQIVSMEPFIKEVKIIEERIIKKSF